MDVKKPSSSRKYFDVAPPGKSAANPSSKPILVSNKPEQADPMMSPPEPSEVNQPEPAVSKFHDDIDLKSEPVDAPPSDENVSAEPEKPAETPPVEITESTMDDTKVFDHPRHKSKILGTLLVTVLTLLIVYFVIDFLINKNILKTSVSSPLAHFLGH
jgi:hypothetical protein